MPKRITIITIILMLAIGLSGCTKVQAPTPDGSGSKDHSPTKIIKPEEAYDIYLKQYPDFKVTGLNLDLEMNKHVYEVEGFMNNKESEVKIDAKTGDIIKDKSEKDLDFNQVEIMREDVLKISDLLEDALTEKDSELREWTLDYDNNILELEVEIKVGLKTIERTYNVDTGQVIEIDN